MPEIKNTFLKAKMNKDLDDRLVPNGEYRDAQNLQISRSEGSSVGEFENIPGNTALVDLSLGSKGISIGQYTDETNGEIYIFSAGYSGNAVCPRDLTLYANGLQAATTLSFKDKTGMSGTVINPQTLGIEVGMLLWTNGTWGGSVPTITPVVTSMTSTTITVDTQTQVSDNDAVTIGWVNTIHRYNIKDDSLALLVRGSFLNFHKDYKIYGVNLLEDLLFWTDNRNQPRKINVDSALNNGITYYTNEDQISVAKYYPYETPMVLEQKITTADAGNYPATGAAVNIRGYEVELGTDPNALGIKVGDIVTGFPGQGAQELWEVIWIEDAGGTDAVVVYNNFYNTPGTAGASWGGGVSLTFSRPTMENSKGIYQVNGFETDVDSTTYAGAPTTIAAGTALVIEYVFNNTAGTAGAQYTPNVGDLITSDNLTGNKLLLTTNPITVADDVRIQSIDVITPGTKIEMKLTKSVKVGTSTDGLRVSANPDYDSTFTGDPDFLEEKFVRFSYRFKYIDNEYSLSAPFTQICFIPKQHGIFGGGLTTSNQDMVSAYDSTVVTFMENNIDTIGLKIPLPLGGATASAAVASLIDDYQISDIEILYKESDALAIKVVDSIPVNETLSSSVTALPSTSTTEWCYDFTYKSSKPYQTLPTSQNTRVYDKVPIKALAQEVVSNRIAYGNYLEGHTPPSGLDYEIILADKSIAYDNYSQYPNHSIKQNRNYQVGFILSDRYGRQSSVVLSSNDADPNTAGSTIYVPYKTYADVDIEDGLSTYEWLGSALRLKLNNGITQLTNNSQTGEPGLYKAYDDTSVDKVTLTTVGAGMTAGTADAIYRAGFVGQGTGLKVTTTVSGGEVTSVVITTPGTGYVDGEVLLIKDGGASEQATITITVNETNVLGWSSYKLAVKQQEQDYYNVYLPGYISGYPVTAATDKGRIAFATLIGDNINKVPRDLNEVGPLQTEFTASVKLYGRVNNPTINNRNVPTGAYYSNRALPWNTQYFPDRFNDEVMVIGPAGGGGLELANSPFYAATDQGFFINSADTNLGATKPQLPWGISGADQSFYLQEQNPLILGLKVGRLTPQPQLTTGIGGAANTLGALVSSTTVSGASAAVLCMNPYLSVSETEPTESLLELFWETSTSGNFVTLNDQVVADYAGVSLVSDSSGTFDEDEASTFVVVNNLKFQDSAGNDLTLDSTPVITSILDSNGNELTSGTPPFIIERVGAPYNNFRIKTNQLFWYGAPTGTKSNVWTLSFQTTYDSGAYVDNLNNVITITLQNVAPTTLVFTSTDASTYTTGQTVATSFDTNSTSFGTFTGKNGTADTANNQQELCWTLSLTSAPAGSTAEWSIDQSGVISKTGTLVNGTYVIKATLTDAAASCSTSTNSLSTDCTVSIVIGTPDTDQAICFQQVSAFFAAQDTSCWTGTGEPLEMFFGVSENVNQATNAAAYGSKSDSFLATLAGTNYSSYSGSGIDLRYYNVRAQAKAAYACGGPPPVAKAFTTGALTQGVLAIKAVFTKIVTAAVADFTTQYTILWRASAADAWQLASPCASCGGDASVNSPTNPGGTVGSFNTMSVTGAGTATASTTYYFDTPGEYILRNNYVGGPGCTSYTGAASFKGEYWDVTTGATGSPCTACTGPL